MLSLHRAPVRFCLFHHSWLDGRRDNPWCYRDNNGQLVFKTDRQIMTSESSKSITELHVLWITAGLGCDGDTIAMTAATQPSIEDIVLGALPGIPKVNFHNPFLAYEVGDDFMEFFHLAADGKLDCRFLLVMEGSIPKEHNKSEVYG